MLKHRVARLEALRQRGPNSGSIPPRRIQTPQDLVDLVEEQVDAVRRAAWVAPLAKAAVIARLASVARHVLETNQLSGRMDTLEAAMAARERSSS